MPVIQKDLKGVLITKTKIQSSTHGTFPVKAGVGKARADQRTESFPVRSDVLFDLFADTDLAGPRSAHRGFAVNVRLAKKR